MLDHETKRKIDNARDILVGKVPDPKSQVEQITIALIYKFMDDMDKESEEWGGKATFFSGEYEKYAWSKIFDPRMGGHEMTALYGEAIEEMNHNPNIPQLFRDIFKNAYLPYRNPETLKSFLKQVNEFTYDHSERLGDAYEYLLSIMSKQGDAGQFRTPRHIIDFIVAVVDPQKNETVLDPACGTAGFLISSYKHIMKSNMKNSPGDQLTPDEKSRLIKNFSGYDISPDMVRLSLVNLYLHGFSNPHILEYDTLTSEERWNETTDVFLANPPFMSPKGGIRPHKRFSIQARRSEVLFVDYIAEHLNPNGRAGVIVPEGIIFQSGNAYKNLRKMLVENYLWAVVSLPAGIFQPYSGVKTSIFFLDKSLAKRTNKILFVKVENDGYGLGAQRKPIDKNDLPKALKFIRNTKIALSRGQEIENTDFAHLVEKTKIAESGDWNLSFNRYIDKSNFELMQFDEIELGEVVEILDKLRKPITKSDRVTGPYPYYGATCILDYVDDYIFDERLVLVGEDGAKWSSGEKTAFIAEGKYWVNNHAHVLRPLKDKLIDIFLVEVLNYLNLNEYVTGVTVPKLNQEKLRSIKIPLPPLDIQKAIVGEIEGYQKIIDGARQVVDNYKPTIKIDPEWDLHDLGSLVEVKGGKRLPKGENFEKENTNYPYLRVVDFSNYSIDLSKLKYISEGTYNQIKKYIISINEVYISIAGTIGLVGMIPPVLDGANLTENAAKLIIIDKLKLFPKYLVYAIASDIVQNQIKKLTHAVGVPKLAIERIRTLQIPLPPLSIQKEIFTQIEAEQEIVNSNKKLVEIYENKIKDKIAEVWGE